MNDFICRTFNSLKVIDDCMLKKMFIGDESLRYTMLDEISYYKNIKDDRVYPKIYKYLENGYIMEYLKDYTPLQYIDVERHKEIFNKLTIIYGKWSMYKVYDSDGKFYKFLKDKIPFDKKIHDILYDYKYDLYDLQIIHGDLSTMNILVNSDNDIKLVDPRGSSIYGSIYYDLAKLYDSYILTFGDIVSGYKHEYDGALYYNFCSGYRLDLILAIVYINMVSKLKMHSIDEQNKFKELADMIYRRL